MHEESRHILHIRIRDLRRSHALTQEELASALGISRQSVNAMEAGRCLPSLPVAMQLASYFAVPLQELLDESMAALAEVQAQVQQSQQRQLVVAPSSVADAFDRLLGAEVVETPPANCYQQSYELVVELPLPGYRTEQLHLEVGDDFLTVSGAAHTQYADRRYFLQEFTPVPFRRTVVLPAQVQRMNAVADFQDGILTVRVPLTQAAPAPTATVSIRSHS
jgi:putative transcriptional regulator